MTFTSLTLYTHGLIPVTWQSHYRLFLASLFIRLDVTLDVSLKACVERVNRVFMSLLVFSLQIKARRGQKVKKKKKKKRLVCSIGVKYDLTAARLRDWKLPQHLFLFCPLSLSPPSRSVLLWRPPCSSTCVTPASSWETPRCSPVWAPRRRSGWLS